jgi:hypothetical protein
MGPYAGVDFNLSLCRLQQMYHRQSMGNPMPESTLFPSQRLRIWPPTNKHFKVQIDFRTVNGCIDMLPTTFADLMISFTVKYLPLNIDSGQKRCR